MSGGTGPVDLARLNDSLARYIRPSTFPVAARMMRPGEEIPPRTKRPLKDFGEKIAICQGIAMARRYGWALFVGPEDASCPIQRTVFGLEPLTAYYTEGHLCANMYTASADLGRKTGDAVAKVAHGVFAGTIVALSRSASRDARDFTARIAAIDPSKRLRPQTLATFDVSLPAAASLTVPSSAVLLELEGSVVFVADGKNQFSRRLVKTGVSASGRLSGVEGLAAGERIVVQGAQLLESERLKAAFEPAVVD